MAANPLKIGDLVWAKMRGWCPWPGKVVGRPLKNKKGHHYILFYGTKNFAWISDKNIVKHNKKLLDKYYSDNIYDKLGSGYFRKAIEAIISASKKPTKKVKAASKSSHISKGANRKKKTRNVVPAQKDINSVQQEQISDHGSGADTSMSISSNSYPESLEPPDVDVESESYILKLKNIQPTEKKIGFLGLGRLGRGIVRNLIQCGHCVTVWNRTNRECQQFVDMGAQKKGTPADVVVSCDIIFCCVSGPEVSKKLVFGNCGLLSGLETFEEDGGETRKNFVELTYLDPKTSQVIRDGVIQKGCGYLEATLNGSRNDVILGTLFILAAGDIDLFKECDSCFRAMGRTALFTGSEVGRAAKYNTVLGKFVGTVSSAMAESLTSIGNLGLEESHFLEILQYSGMASPVLVEKAKALI